MILEALPLLVLTLGVGGVAALVGFWWAAFAAGMAALFILWFFRDPERVIPQGRFDVVSPADGKVVEILKVYEDHHLDREAIKIGIFMSPLDVHVNRIPYEGKIVSIRHRPGKFLSAFKADASVENEQNAVVLETPAGVRILFVQIAGALARRIVYWIQEGDPVMRGQRFGLIKFGSRLDLYVPPDCQVSVRPSQRVKAGETVIGTIQ